MTNSSSSPATVPVHLGIIPDGNRRWAAAKGLSTFEGHKQGYENLKKIAESALDRGVKVLSVFSFSTENWQRTPEEVSYLMQLLGWILDKEVDKFNKQGIKLQFFGSKEGVDQKILAGIDRAVELTKGNTQGTLNICFNYGGRADIAQAAARLIDKGVKPADVTEAALAAELSSAGLPDIDMVIRTSGERRLSNFMLWEAAYAELYFADQHWPDFDETELDKALSDFAERQRRFGK